MIIVLVDIRENNGHILAIVDENENIAQYETIEDAREKLKDHPLAKAFPVLYVDIDNWEVNG